MYNIFSFTHNPWDLAVTIYSRGQIKESTKWGNGTHVTRGSGGMAPIIFWCFRALRELLVQFEVNNNYSTAVAPTDNHDFMLWLTCCIKLKCIVGIQNKPLCHYLDLPLLFWWFCICLLHWNWGELGLDWIWRPAAVRIHWQACWKPHWVNMWPQTFCSEAGEKPGRPPGGFQKPQKPP